MDEDLQRHLNEHPEFTRPTRFEAKRVLARVAMSAAALAAGFTIYAVTRDDPSATAQKTLARCGAPNDLHLYGLDGTEMRPDSEFPSMGIIRLVWSSTCALDDNVTFAVLADGQRVETRVDTLLYDGSLSAQLRPALYFGGEHVCFTVAAEVGGRLGERSEGLCFATDTEGL